MATSRILQPTAIQVGRINRAVGGSHPNDKMALRHGRVFLEAIGQLAVCVIFRDNRDVTFVFVSTHSITSLRSIALIKSP